MRVERRRALAVPLEQLLVALARPDASFVAGFKAWLDLGYCVRKGEKAIRIIALMPVTERDRATGEETGETITLFKGVSVFDAQQVEPLPAGEPTPLQPPSQPLSGDSHAHLIAPTIAFAESLGYTVSFEPIAAAPAAGATPRPSRSSSTPTVPPTRGCARSSTRRSTPSESTTSTTREPKPRSSSTPPPWSCSAALAWTSQAKPSPYIAGWGEDGALDAVTQFAQLIDDLARRVEAALSTAGDTQQTAATG